MRSVPAIRGERGFGSRELQCPGTTAREPYGGHGALLLFVLPFWQILSLLPVGRMHSAWKQLLCMASVSCGGGKLLFDGMPAGLRVLFPKGWVPPRPAAPVPQTRQEELSSSRPGGGRADGFVITSNALQRVGEFHFHASEV